MGILIYGRGGLLRDVCERGRAAKLQGGKSEGDTVRIGGSVTDPLAALEGTNERLGHDIVRHVWATSGEHIDGPPQPGANGGIQLGEVVPLFHDPPI